MYSHHHSTSGDRMENRYGTWNIVEATGRAWLCRCDCGVTRRVIRSDLWSGRSKNCGCIRKVTMREAQRQAVTTHGMEKTPEYRVWVDMRRRCADPRRPDFKNYGARGITVCDEWAQSFEAFYRDMGPRPEQHTMDRLNNDGPYAKWNCVWATRKLQERNKRTSRIVQIDGRRMTVAEACEVYGIKKATAENRLNALGWTAEDTFKRPVANRGQPR